MPTDLNPDTQTRADARVSYYDPYRTRENFHVITGQHVTQVLFEGITDNEEASDPTYGGNVNGDGSAAAAGLGFDLGSKTTLPSKGKRNGQLPVRGASITNLRVTGVEVSCLMLCFIIKMLNYASLPPMLQRRVRLYTPRGRSSLLQVLFIPPSCSSFLVLVRLRCWRNIISPWLSIYLGLATTYRTIASSVLSTHVRLF